MLKFDQISAPIEDRIATGFARIATVMRSEAWEFGKLNDLTPTQCDVLALLSSRGVPLRLTVIAEQLAISLATASPAVSTLVEKGLVRKNPAIDDARAIAITLTRRGKGVAGSVAGITGAIGVAVASLKDSEKNQLLESIVKVIRHLQVDGKIPTLRMCVACKYFDANIHESDTHPHHCHFVGEPMGNQHLRMDCPEHMEAEPVVLLKNWKKYAG